MKTREADIKEKAQDCAPLELKLKLGRAVFSRGESVMGDLVNQLCTGYSLLLRLQSSGYRDRLNDVFLMHKRVESTRTATVFV